MKCPFLTITEFTSCSSRGERRGAPRDQADRIEESFGDCLGRDCAAFDPEKKRCARMDRADAV